MLDFIKETIKLSSTLNILFILNILFTAIVIFLERKNPSSTWAWIMVLLFMPTLGFVLYLFLSQNFTRKKLFKLKKNEEYISNKIKEFQMRKIKDGNIQFKNKEMMKYSQLIKMNLQSDNAIFTQDNEIEIYSEGKPKFDELIKCIKAAKTHIHIMYYIFRQDDIGMKLINALAEKAREGVEVRLIYDAVGSKFIKRKAFKELRKAGGQVELFFPSSIPILNFKINYRNHRKITVIDGQIGFVGGFNVGNEYLGLDDKFGYWRDTHIKIIGGGVASLQARFLLDWRLASKEKIENLFKYFTYEKGTGNAGIQIVSSGPDSIDEQIKYGYIKMINDAKFNIYIQTPYFIPDVSVVEAIKLAALSGVDVKIMIPKITDHKIVHWASMSYMGELLDVGVKIYGYEKGFLHAKTCCVDGNISTVGTANLDNRSFRLNFEVNGFIFDDIVTSELENIFKEDLKYCKEITKSDYLRRSNLDKIKESICRLIGPLL